MKDIKTRENKKDIKMLDRAAGLAKVTKDATVRTKDQVQNLSDDGQITPDEYAEDKIKYMAESAIEDTGKAAKKTVQKTYDGGKRLYKEIRRTRKETDAIKQTAKSTGKSTAKTLQKSIKTGQRTVKTAQRCTPFLRQNMLWTMRRVVRFKDLALQQQIPPCGLAVQPQIRW